MNAYYSTSNDVIERKVLQKQACLRLQVLSAPMSCLRRKRVQGIGLVNYVFRAASAARTFIFIFIL